MGHLDTLEDFYTHRWADSTNGSADVVPPPCNPRVNTLHPSPMNPVMNQIQFQERRPILGGYGSDGHFMDGGSISNADQKSLKIVT